MAFSDVIDKPNADAFLVAVIEPKTATGGAASSVGISERYVIAPDVAPGGSGDRKYNGIVEAWGDFGYVGQATPPAFVVSDGSVVLSALKGLGPYASLGDLLKAYELHGARITIAQCIEDSTTSSGYSARVFFRGYINGLEDMTAESVGLAFTDTSEFAAQAPAEEVNKVGFPDAPDEALGLPVPIVLGNFRTRAPESGSMFRSDLILFGFEHWDGVPTVKVNTMPNDETYMGAWRIACHKIKGLEDGESAVQEPELEYPSVIYPGNGVLDNPGTYADLKLKRPPRLQVCFFPNENGPATTATEPYKAWDGKEDTYVTLARASGGAKYLEGKLTGLPELGSILAVYVEVWFKGGGSGTVYVGLANDPTLFVNGTYGTYDATYEGIRAVNVTSGAGIKQWDLSDYTIRAKILDTQVATAYIRGMRIVVEYNPYRGAQSGSWSGGHVWGGFGKPTTFGTRGELLPDNPPLIVFAQGAPDDVSGTYTGVGNALIEKGPDVAHYFAANFMGLASTEIETSDGIGDFEAARTALGAYHVLAFRAAERRPSIEYFEEICQQSRAMPVFNSSGKLGMVVISSDPVPDYRTTGDPYQWEPGRDFYENTFRCWRTPISEVANRIYIDFAYCHNTGKFRRTAFITPEATDNGFGTDDDAARKLKAGYSETRFGEGREFRLRAYHVRKQGVAKKLRNFYFDTLWRPRVSFEFETGVNACDLSVGNVIMFAGAVHTINGWALPNPDVTSKNWSSYYWYVTGVTRMESAGDVSRILVRATEAVIPPSANDWIAAADDTP